MRYNVRIVLPSLLLLTAPVCCRAVGSTTHRPPGHITHASLHHVTSHSRATHSAVHREVASMPAERATQIQIALIQKGYLSGEPTGAWDAQSVAAMQHLQSDNGWQTKITPDSRALIKLGLGPQAPPTLTTKTSQPQ